MSYYTTVKAKIKVFPVCGQSCGQSRFSARFAVPVKSRKRPCCKAFRASAVCVVDGASNAPKCGAVPTPLHPDIQFFAIIPRWGRKSKFFLSVVNPVVKAVFRPVFTACQNPANARAARLSGLPLLRSWMVSTALPNVARYQLRYTRIFSFCYYTTLGAKMKDFPVCGHSCGQSRISARFDDPAKWRKRPCRKAFRASTSLVVDGVGATPKPRALPTALHPDNCLNSDSFHSIVYFERDCKYSSPVIRYFSEQNCF